jgi:hypothetical protein
MMPTTAGLGTALTDGLGRPKPLPDIFACLAQDDLGKSWQKFMLLMADNMYRISAFVAKYMPLVIHF